MDSRGDERQKQGILDEAKASSPIINKLCRQGYRFNFFQAVNLLERLHESAVRKTSQQTQKDKGKESLHSSASQEFSPPGQEGPLSQEMIRFRASPKRSFPSSEIAHLRPGKHNESNIALVVLTFMGLYGVDSPLPSYFSDIIAALAEADAVEEEVDSEDEEGGIRALRDLLDLFDHRIYSLFYRGWKKYRYYLQFEAGAKDPFSQYMLSLMGLGTPVLQDSVGVEASRLIAYTGIIGQRVRCAAGLQNLLSEYFGGINVEVIEFMPRWVRVPEQYKTRLGTKAARFGESVTVGKRIRDFGGKFRVVLGPLKLEAFRRFLPSGVDSQELRRLVRFYAPDQLSFDVELLLRKEEVPPLKLGSDLAQLGWTSWLGKPRKDIVSIVFSFDSQ